MFLFGQITVPDEEQLDHQAMYHPMTLAQLGRNYSYVSANNKIRSNTIRSNMDSSKSRITRTQFISLA